jgi:hypothetical protein
MEAIPGAVSAPGEREKRIPAPVFLATTTAAGAAPTVGSGEAATPDLPASINAALDRLAAETTPSGGSPVKELTVVVKAGDLGRVAIRAELGSDGAIQLELTALSTQAAQTLRDQLPALAQVFQGRQVQVQIAPVAVGMPVAFTGGEHGGRPPRWFDRRTPVASGGRSAVSGLADFAQSRQNYLVDVLA